MSHGPKQKTFKFHGLKIRFQISGDGKRLLVRKVNRAGEQSHVFSISKSQARRLADWLDWWTK